VILPNFYLNGLIIFEFILYWAQYNLVLGILLFSKSVKLVETIDENPERVIEEL
jgi:hypothetical protein